MFILLTFINITNRTEPKPLYCKLMRVSQTITQSQLPGQQPNPVRASILQTGFPGLYQNNLMTSRISQRMRSLSPAEGKTARISTLLQPGEQLIPTDHVWKVRGKKFTPVEVEVRQGAPIPAHLLRVPPPVTRETVYQIKNTGMFQRSMSQNQSIANLRTVFPIRHEQLQQQRPTIVVPPVLTDFRPVSQDRRIASPVRVSVRPSMPILNGESRTIEPISPINRQNLGSSKNMIDENQSKLHRQNVTNQYYGPPAKNQGKKNQYKYNLFSAVDEAVNSKCGSCGPNEIIATKPMSSWQ